MLKHPTSFLKFKFKFKFMHLADAFIQSNLQCIQAINFYLSCVPGDRTPNLALVNTMLNHLSYRNTLERWETAFKQKIFNEAQSLTSTAEIWCLLNAAGGQGSENDWDSDVICPATVASPAPGKKKTKISPTEAVDRLVHFHKVKLTILLQSHCECLNAVVFKHMVLGIHPSAHLSRHWLKVSKCYFWTL
uniref:Uncharacterized protein n=1 Tax=Cyprinus carpio carpio TaxID=630221 RepID=A0A9J7X3C2_CYPCA